MRSNSGLLELVKWLAFAGMLVDHAWKVLAFDAPLWAVIVGRMVFPAFALVFAYNVARPGADVWRIVRRLVLFGLIAQPVHALAFQDVAPLNILFTFAVAACAIGLWSRPWAVALVVLVGGLFVDYAWVGVMFVLAGWYWWRRPETWEAAAAVALAYSALCWWNGNAWAMWTVPLLVVLQQRTSLHWPRWGAAFYVAYPVHFAALMALRAAGVGGAHG